MGQEIRTFQVIFVHHAGDPKTLPRRQLTTVTEELIAQTPFVDQAVDWRIWIDSKKIVQKNAPGVARILPPTQHTIPFLVPAGWIGGGMPSRKSAYVLYISPPLQEMAADLTEIHRELEQACVVCNQGHPEEKPERKRSPLASLGAFLQDHNNLQGFVTSIGAVAGRDFVVEAELIAIVTRHFAWEKVTPQRVGQLLSFSEQQGYLEARRSGGHCAYRLSLRGRNLAGITSHEERKEKERTALKPLRRLLGNLRKEAAAIEKQQRRHLALMAEVEALWTQYEMDPEGLEVLHSLAEPLPARIDAALQKKRKDIFEVERVLLLADADALPKCDVPDSLDGS